MSDNIQTMKNHNDRHTLLTVSCGIIIEKEDKILLQRCPGETNWHIPCGTMKMGETYQETAIRGVFEETALTVDNMQLFGIHSGRDCIVTYKTGQKGVNLQVIFYTTDYSGKVKIKDEHNREHRFFKKNNLPKNLNPQQKRFIMDWKNNEQTPIVN